MADYFAESLTERTLPMSAVQTYLITHADSADDALMNLDELAAEAIRVSDREETVESDSARFEAVDYTL